MLKISGESSRIQIIFCINKTQIFYVTASSDIPSNDFIYIDTKTWYNLGLSPSERQ